MQCHLEGVAAMQVRRQFGLTKAQQRVFWRVLRMRSVSGRVHDSPCGNPLSYKRRTKAAVQGVQIFG